jgi:hypothetical protein
MSTIEVAAELRRQRDAYCAARVATASALDVAKRIIDQFAQHGARCNYYPADLEGDGGTPCDCGLDAAHRELREELHNVETANKNL